ncbi:choline/ethanolamine phosphotransferase [Fistulifera solaris]|uniref:Choline/ethanolamine phosphotransferase n=1 Tax=Fistulifera solaris TaxID=1519565 RepID=A0A1Z5JGT8_FISSO|nr:choline/ethanolamine phosphotransferase [Fistulifera solaris]|eukprot:GAX13136.1 choline/ethanolamine phosphotransferase [Fistulifera solaris]
MCISNDTNDPALTIMVWQEDSPWPDVLTKESLQRIARHQYRSGVYTWLDNLCNPLWTALTECLPSRMAPNLVTLLGAMSCLVSYAGTWYYAPTATEALPAVWLIVNGILLITAYTLDCMDGKQARRTQTSSPLGQLLDHGLDCLCLLAHVAAVQGWLRAGDSLQLQMIVQSTFYLAQWEEYFTGILPHGTGPIGVTEVNYGLAFLSILFGTVWKDATTNPDRGPFDDALAPYVQIMLENEWLPAKLLNGLGGSPALLDAIADWQIKDAMLFAWFLLTVTLCSLSMMRVAVHLKSWKNTLRAFLQLITPLLIVTLALLDEFPTDHNSPPVHQAIRWKSFAVGLLYCYMTIKVIVFSMSRQSIAIVQLDVLPLLMAVGVSRYDPRLTAEGHVLLWQGLSLWWGLQLWNWAATASRQICSTLGIQMFTIPPITRTEI